MKSERFVVMLGVLSLALGCAKPAQLGGLGVFNPNGFEGRMAMVGELDGTSGIPPQGETDETVPPETAK